MLSLPFYMCQLRGHWPTSINIARFGVPMSALNGLKCSFPDKAISYENLQCTRSEWLLHVQRNMRATSLGTLSFVQRNMRAMSLGTLSFVQRNMRATSLGLELRTTLLKIGCYITPLGHLGIPVILDVFNNWDA